MTALTIHQPNLFPRLKVLQKINHADIWVIFDDVQFVAREWQNRTRLRFFTKPDQDFWFSIPVHRPNGQQSSINTVTICEAEKTNKIFSEVIRHAYRKSTYWAWIDSYLSEINRIDTPNIADYCVNSTLIALSLLGIKKEIIHSSALKINGSKNDKLVNICSSLHANIYISGSGGLSYLNESLFRQHHIKVDIQRWVSPVTLSPWGSLSWRNYSFLDFVARCGPDMMKEHIYSWNSNTCYDIGKI